MYKQPYKYTEAELKQALIDDMLTDYRCALRDGLPEYAAGETCAECSNPPHECETHNPESECIGLSFAYVCLDGGEALCQACFEKDGTVEVIPCDCE